MADGALLYGPRRFPKGGRGRGLLDFEQIDPKLAPIVENIFSASPALARHRDDFAVVQGRPMPANMAGGQLESYPPEELFNPIPGKSTTELFNQSASPEEQQQLITGDMLHRLGAIDATTSAPVDPDWHSMKTSLLQSMTPEQTTRNKMIYQHYLDRGWNGSFDDFMSKSQGDEFIMGSVTSDKGDYWRGRPGSKQQSVYTPQQDEILNRMKQYLAGVKR